MEVIGGEYSRLLIEIDILQVRSLGAQNRFALDVSAIATDLEHFRRTGVGLASRPVKKAEIPETVAGEC